MPTTLTKAKWTPTSCPIDGVSLDEDGICPECDRDIVELYRTNRRLYQALCSGDDYTAGMAERALAGIEANQEWRDRYDHS